MQETDECICGVEVPSGDTGLCFECEEGLGVTGEAISCSCISCQKDKEVKAWQRSQ